MTPEEIRATLLEVLLEVEEATHAQGFTSPNYIHYHRRDALRALVGTPKPPTPYYGLPPAKPVTVNFEVPRDALPNRLGAIPIDIGTKVETPPRPNPLPAGYAPGRDGLRVGMRFRQTNKYIEVLEIKEDTAVVRITDKKDAPFVDQWSTSSLGHMFLCEPFKYEDK